MANKRIRWSEEEIAAVADATKAYLTANPQSSLATAILHSQSTSIPVSSRLAEISIRCYTKHSAGLRTALTAVGVTYPCRIHRKPGKAPKTAPNSQAVALPSPNVDPALSMATQAQLIARLLSLQAEEIKALVKKEIAAQIASAFEVAEEPDHQPSAVSKSVKPSRSFKRYLIIGLLPVQAGIVAQRLKDHCDLRFWADGGTDKLRSGCGWADCVVSMTKFISHSTEDVVKKTEKPIIRCNGGVTDLVSQIQHNLENS